MSIFSWLKKATTVATVALDKSIMTDSKFKFVDDYNNGVRNFLSIQKNRVVRFILEKAIHFFFKSV